MQRNQLNSNRRLFRFRGPSPDAVLLRLPPLKGSPITVTYRPKLTAYKGRLLSRSQKGNSVYAGCFLRKRIITLDDSLLHTRRVWERIFAHEVAHFVWSKMRPELRFSYEQLIWAELRNGIPGELGWSSESIKLRLLSLDPLTQSCRWRNYLCESFCDTAGWILGSARTYAELTLPVAVQHSRKEWWHVNLVGQSLRFDLISRLGHHRG